MALTINPNADETPDSGTWSLTTGSDIWAILDGAGNYIYTSEGETGKDFRVDFTFPTFGAMETIDSIQACVTGHTGNTRSDTATLLVAVEDGGDSNSDFFTDTHTVTDNGGTPATYCSAVESFSTGQKLEDIRMMGEVTSYSGGSPTCNLYQAYIIVNTSFSTTYTSDDQVTLSGGTLELKNGMTIIGSKN